MTVTFCRLLGGGGPEALRLPRGARRLGVRTSPTGEKITHTGQLYDDKDYRKIRFVGRKKEVNENFVIDFIAEQPVSGADSPVVACDSETKTGTCGYCGRQFRQQQITRAAELCTRLRVNTGAAKGPVLCAAV
uniref:Uncharacterized protein n=1 Tax=Panthera tigris altaica TaxID=74533 RepID=A0A8C9JB87_PANTA